jgi:crossover junction endodeoxyribonuclease RuvC
MQNKVRILGIDPGLRRMGWGVIEQEGSRLKFLACGSIEPDPKLELGERLAILHKELTKLVQGFSPDEAAVEETFVNKDAKATLKLGHARGVAMLVPAQAGLPTGEYAPNQVKKTVVGVGHAEKEQIRLMVKVLLPLADFRSDDAADALAIAITHAQNRKALSLARALK